MPADAAQEIPSSSQARPTRPPRAFVVFDPPKEEIGATIDWSKWYLTDEDDMGRSPEHTDIIKVFESSAQTLALERSWENIRIGVDEFFAWMAEEPLVRISPDVFLLDDPLPEPGPGVWETWRSEVNPPRFALEIVSEDWKKDYLDSPPKYAQLGASELVIYDPKAARGAVSTPERAALQVFRLDPDGSFVRVQVSDRIARSEELDAWLVVKGQDEGAGLRLRISRDPEGADIVPTEAEARREAEQRHWNEQKARVEAERKYRQEQQARLDAEQRLLEARDRLIRRVAQRFGPLSEDHHRQLEALDSEELLDRLLTAQSLDELLG